MHVASLASDTRTGACRCRVPRRLALARHLLLTGSVTEDEARQYVRIKKGFDRELQRLEGEGLVVDMVPQAAWHRRGYRVLEHRYYLRSIPSTLLDEVDGAFSR